VQTFQTALRGATRWAYESPRSPTRRWRSRRFTDFQRLVRPPAGARIVDLGGTPYMWELFEHDYRVTLVNLPSTEHPEVPAGYEWIEADACALEGVFDDGAFDIVFSNSVIEHVGPPERQAAFAAQVRRLAPAYWVQTPSRRFPIEAHTGVPFYWQRSEARRDRRIARWREDLEEWAAMIAETRVLTTPQLRALFPEAGIYRERLLGLEKSITAYRPAR